MEERLDTGSSADRQYVWGVKSIDDLILRDDAELRLYALNDAMGSVTAVVDTSGSVQERYGYNGFGAPRYMDASFSPRTGSDYDWETLFDGYRYDTGTGLYQVRYRYLHPKLGRWLSWDLIDYDAGINLFAYVKNKPIKDIDLWGLTELLSTGGRQVGLTVGSVVRTPPTSCPTCQVNAPPSSIIYDPETGRWEARQATDKDRCELGGGKWVTNAELLGMSYDECIGWFEKLAWEEVSETPNIAEGVIEGATFGIACAYFPAGIPAFLMSQIPFVGAAIWCTKETCTY